MIATFMFCIGIENSAPTIAGMPIVGFTWYSLTDPIDWDSAPRLRKGNVNPLGLLELDRKIRKVGKEYRKLIAAWKDVLPARTIRLTVPVVPPDEIGNIGATGRGGAAAHA
ncbi:hypothetical protein [Novosphingobium sp.]|uniref:hypothetical protein n=1 Tax=Novosphingobium sp. TaxID=1874826 RepID=UPI0026034D08|nr:hypothetical protein [Novosphingobium sp.]